MEEAAPSQVMRSRFWFVTVSVKTSPGCGSPLVPELFCTVCPRDVYQTLPRVPVRALPPDVKVTLALPVHWADPAPQGPAFHVSMPVPVASMVSVAPWTYQLPMNWEGIADCETGPTVSRFTCVDAHPVPWYGSNSATVWFGG
jgi:hypothetical protein